MDRKVASAGQVTRRSAAKDARVAAVRHGLATSRSSVRITPGQRAWAVARATKRRSK